MLNSGGADLLCFKRSEHKQLNNIFLNWVCLNKRCVRAKSAALSVVAALPADLLMNRIIKRKTAREHLQGAWKRSSCMRGKKEQASERMQKLCPLFVSLLKARCFAFFVSSGPGESERLVKSAHTHTQEEMKKNDNTKRVQYIQLIK